MINWRSVIETTITILVWFGRSENIVLRVIKHLYRLINSNKRIRSRRHRTVPWINVWLIFSISKFVSFMIVDNVYSSKIHHIIKKSFVYRYFHFTLDKMNSTSVWTFLRAFLCYWEAILNSNIENDHHSHSIVFNQWFKINSKVCHVK